MLLSSSLMIHVNALLVEMGVDPIVLLNAQQPVEPDAGESVTQEVAQEGDASNVVEQSKGPVLEIADGSQENLPNLNENDGGNRDIISNDFSIGSDFDGTGALGLLGDGEVEVEELDDTLMNLYTESPPIMPPVSTAAAEVDVNININEAPTDITLDNAAIDENATGVVGNLSALDPDLGDSHSFSIVSGDAAFAIVNGQLVVNTPLDFESQASYDVQVKATDADGLEFTKTLTITVNDINEIATDITLDNAAIDENATGVVGNLSALDPDLGDSHSFSIVSGDAAFAIVNGQLVVNTPLDFESQASYDVQVKATDADGLEFTKTLTITVNDINEVATDITLDNAAIDENATGVVGNLSALDPDLGDSHSFSIVSGDAAFAIVNGQLVVNTPLDFESQASYDVQVKATDADGLEFTKTLTITVNDLVENITVGTPLNTIADLDALVVNVESFNGTLVDGDYIFDYRVFLSDRPDPIILEGIKASDGPHHLTFTDGTNLQDLVIMPLTQGDPAVISSDDSNLIYNFDPDPYEGGGGDDIIHMQTAGTLSGDAEDLSSETGGNDEIYGHDSGTSLMFGDASNSMTSSAAGNDTLQASGKAEMYGDALTMTGSTAGNDLLIGGDEDDLIFGDASSMTTSVGGNDYIKGGGGDDDLWGDAGTMIASAGGVDKFAYDLTIDNGTDTIHDFQAGKDILRFENVLDTDADLSLLDEVMVTDGGSGTFDFADAGGNVFATIDFSGAGFSLSGASMTIDEFATFNNLDYELV